jgi:hypothetical protein
MSNILNELGVDEDDLDWYHLAACRGLDTNLFYDKYEADPNIAKSIDEACLTCPVSKMCYDFGVTNKEQGVWGGVYLNTGEVDKPRNIHKTQDVWKRIKAKNGIHK